MIERILRKLRSEPVRVRLYSVAALVLGYLAQKNVLSPSDVTFYLTLAGIVLAVESSRTKVEPLAKQRQ